jgi:hypothetical protein
MYRQAHTREDHMQRISGASGRGRRIALVAVLTLGVAALGAYRQASGAASRTTYGDPVTVGRGTARTYVTVTNGAPAEVGVALSESALAGLPNEDAPGGMFAHGHKTFDYVLPLPKGSRSPFRHVLLNWNPGGHEPPGIYDTPHFDFHFYVIENEERVAIDPADPEYQRKAERTPPAEVIPERYFLPAPVAVARMGVHWVDSLAPEFKGKPFTSTFLYGTWSGKVIFGEPMITKAFLETKPQFSAPLPQPPRGREAGYYAKAYSVRWDAGAKEYRVTLTGIEGRR